MQRLLIYLMILNVIVSCSKSPTSNVHNVQKNELIGEWSSKCESEFLIFKDSVILPASFYLFTNWKIDNSKVKIYNIESSPRDDSVWVDYVLDSYYDDSLVMKSSAFKNDSTMTLYRRMPEEENMISFIKLQRLVYPGEDVLLEINVEGDGEIQFRELNTEKNWISSECSLDKDEMGILNSLLERLTLSELDSMYISGISDQNYYLLEISTVESDRTYSTIVDTGGSSPNILSRIITFVWATAKLKCAPNRYNYWNTPGFDR